MAWPSHAEPGALSVLAAARDLGAGGPPALVVAGEPMPWGELATRVREALTRLEADDRGLGAGAPPPRVLVGDSRLETLVWIYALLHRGTPMVLLHPRHPREDHDRFLARCGWRRRPASGRGGGDEPWPVALETTLSETTSSETTLSEAASSETASERDPLARWRRDEGGCPVVILRTSGSAGGPKGVVLTHDALLASASASAENLGWQPDDRWLLTLPLAHVGGFSILVRCLVARRTVVVEPMERFDPERVAALLEARSITLLSLVPTTLARLLDRPDAGPPPGLRAVLLGGAATPPGLLRRAALAGWPVLTTYGCTEAGSQIATTRPGSPPDPAQGSGPPLPTFEVRLVDGEGKEIDEGVIAIHGPALMAGYLPPCDEVFNPEGFFLTGDLGRFDAAGNLHVLGRRDEVIISGGENVHPNEVEALLAECPMVTEACVVGVADPRWGQTVAAALVARPVEGDPGAMLDSWAREHLAPHQRPRRLIWLDALPRNATGKIDRLRVRQLVGVDTERSGG